MHLRACASACEGACVYISMCQRILAFLLPLIDLIFYSVISAADIPAADASLSNEHGDSNMDVDLE